MSLTLNSDLAVSSYSSEEKSLDYEKSEGRLSEVFMFV